MKRWNFGGTRRSDLQLLQSITALAVTLAVAGCASHAKQSAQAPTASSATDQAADSTAAPGPEAKIQISYSQANDFLHTLSMTKYSGATVLTTSPAGADGTASVLRFDGGAPTWQINIEPGMFSELPLGFSAKSYAISEVKYGTVPPHFLQTIPDLGPPEPLEPGHFYIFSVTRKSGSVSYDAVKVNADGTLQAYEAEPRAGTSFKLCCNLPSDFTVAAPTPPLVPTAPTPDASGL